MNSEQSSYTQSGNYARTAPSTPCSHATRASGTSASILSRRDRRNIWNRKKDGKRRDLLKERRRCEPHLGLELDGLLEKLKEAASKVPTLPDYVVMEAERLICVFISLKETNSVAGADRKSVV